MLTDQQLELLTGFVDGELSSRQRKAVMRLLKQSPQARKILRQLQGDSGVLKSAQKLPPPQDLPVQIMEKVKLIVPRPAPVVSPNLPFPQWMGIAIAASVLVCVTAFSYLYFKHWNPSPENSKGDLAKKNTDPTNNNNSPLEAREFQIAQLDQTSQREALKKAIGSKSSFQVVMKSTNSAETMKQLEKLFQTVGISLAVDENSRKEILGRQRRSFVLLVENLQPYEFTTMVEEIHLQQKNGKKYLNSFSLQPMTLEKRSEVASFLGISLLDLQPAGKSDGKKNSKFVGDRLALVLPGDSEAGRTPSIDRFLASRQTSRPGTIQMVIVVEEYSV